jgi:hypothetical protein
MGHLVLVERDHWQPAADGATLVSQQAKFVSEVASPSLGRARHRFL